MPGGRGLNPPRYLREFTDNALRRFIREKFEERDAQTRMAAKGTSVTASSNSNHSVNQSAPGQYMRRKCEASARGADLAKKVEHKE